ncbi:hypothetical protein CARUB_v10016358mg, partial [Capsella rubella]
MKEDRISQLPDALICQILTHLPTKNAVKTSVLSTRWTNLWLWLPRLELSFSNIFNALGSFGDRFYDSNRVSCIDKLKLSITNRTFISVNDVAYLTSWVAAAVKRRIQHLEAKCDPSTCIWFSSVPELVIEAPGLCGLKILDTVSNIVITNILESIAKLDIALRFGFNDFNSN